jgi:hypothetical protein
VFAAEQTTAKEWCAANLDLLDAAAELRNCTIRFAVLDDE